MAVSGLKQLKEFYEHSKKGEKTKYVYPDIVPHVMSSLADLLEIELTVQDVMLTFLKALQSKSERLFTGSLSAEEVPMFQNYYERVMERNRNVLEN